MVSISAAASARIGTFHGFAILAMASSPNLLSGSKEPLLTLIIAVLELSASWNCSAVSTRMIFTPAFWIE
jgi:hypothetical protein